MRFAFISTAAALSALASVSVGHAQNKPTSPAPAATTREYETYWPTAAQEAAIPYHPCEIAMGWENRRLICWSTEPWARTRIAHWHRQIRH